MVDLISEKIILCTFSVFAIGVVPIIESARGVGPTE